MRILKISDVYYPRVNGVSTSIRTFTREMLAQGHEVTLLAPAYPAATDDDIDVIRVPSRYVVVDPEDRLMRRTPLRAQTEALRRRAFDVIHIHTPFAAHFEGVRLARALDLPVIETYHTYFEEYLDKYLPWLPRGLPRYVARRFSRSQCAEVDAVVVPTQPMLDVLRGYGVTARAEVIPTGIPSGAFSRGDGARFRARHGIDVGRPILLYVGRVAHEKNIDFLLQVTGRVRLSHPDVLLVIAGEGPATGHLKRLRDRLGLAHQVRFVDYLSREVELPDCYAAGDVFVFASSTETQGLVLLESMQAGTPVVTTAVMGTAEVMADRRGGLVADASVPDFAAQVCRLLDDPVLRQALSTQAVDKAARWSAPQTAARLLDLYRSCLPLPEAPALRAANENQAADASDNGDRVVARPDLG